MPAVSASLVDILREFLEADELLRKLTERFRSGNLAFPELRALVGDDEGSVLFRLKEKCHAVFRPGSAGSRVAQPREALFDLAVGSLFHEAMKFREDFYQREVYGPRVSALRAQANREADGLFVEFERILSAVAERLEEGLRETHALMDQSWKQFRVLLAEHPENGFVTRYLIERRSALEDLSPPGVDTLLAEIHGSAAEGYAVAGRSYLASGHYEAADALLAEAIERGADRDEAQQLSAYARGMAAYLAGDYDECIARLSAWVGAGGAGDRPLHDLAHAAISRIGQLVSDEDRERVGTASKVLLEKITAGRRLTGSADGRSS